MDPIKRADVERWFQIPAESKSGESFLFIAIARSRGGKSKTFSNRYKVTPEA
jgi:hypothetical protein